MYFFVVGMLLFGLTLADAMPPALLLAFTFALGAGTAVQLPAWQAVVPELVPRSALRAATRLEMLGLNVARSLGPALAGLIIARSGVPLVFALNALSVAFLAVALLFWRRPSAATDVRRERFVPALRSGGRYVWNEPVVRLIMVRALLFITPAMALWGLLPLVANDLLGVGAGGFGALFGALGVGAVTAALVLGRVRDHISTNGLLGLGSLVYAAALVGVVVVPGFVAALLVLVLAGLAWTTVASTLQAELQLFLPAWVRARGLAVYMVVFTGSQAAGALVWGLIAQHVSLEAGLLVPAAVMLVGAVAGLFLSVPETGHLDREPAVYWSEPRLAIEPEPDGGPVLVAVYYTVAPERETGFLAVMDDLRRSRMRTGASRWELYRDGERPERFTEMFSVPSWEEHLRQHEGRLTAADREAEAAAQAFSDPPSHADHLFPPT